MIADTIDRDDNRSPVPKGAQPPEALEEMANIQADSLTLDS